MSSTESILDRFWNGVIRLSRSLRESLLSVLPTVPVLFGIFYFSDAAVSFGGAPFLIWYYVSLSALIAFFIWMYSIVHEQLSDFWEASLPDIEVESTSLRKKIQDINSEYSQPDSTPQHISSEEVEPILPHLIYSVRQLITSLMWFLFFASLYALSAILVNLRAILDSLQGESLTVLIDTMGSVFPPVGIILQTGLVPTATPVAVSVFFLISASLVTSITAITNLFKASENIHRLVFVKITSRPESLIRFEPVLYLPLTLVYLFAIQSLM